MKLSERQSLSSGSGTSTSTSNSKSNGTGSSGSVDKGGGVAGRGSGGSFHRVSKVAVGVGTDDGGGLGLEEPCPGYYVYRHPGPAQVYHPQTHCQTQNYIPITINDQNEISYALEVGGKRQGKTGSVSVDNGALNLHIPMAFSYPYDVPVPPQPQPELEVIKEPPKRRSGSMSKDKEKGSSGEIKKSNSAIASASATYQPPLTVKKSSSGSGGNHCKQPNYYCPAVRCGEYYNNQGKAATCGGRTRNKCGMTWDMCAGQRVPYQVVDYGQELYEEAAQNLARELEAQRLAERKYNKALAEDDVEDNCYDFANPGVNSSRNVAKALERAIENLKSLPEEVETMLRQDKRFEPVVLGKATKSLNVGKNNKVFKDLIPVDPIPDVRTETENIIQAEIRKSIEAARPPSRPKDPEPKLEDFQSNSYTRIRPAPVETPPKPSSGISLRENHDFDSIELEYKVQESSYKLEK